MFSFVSERKNSWGSGALQRHSGRPGTLGIAGDLSIQCKHWPSTMTSKTVFSCQFRARILRPWLFLCTDKFVILMNYWQRKYSTVCGRMKNSILPGQIVSGNRYGANVILTTLKLPQGLEQPPVLLYWVDGGESVIWVKVPAQRSTWNVVDVAEDVSHIYCVVKEEKAVGVWGNHLYGCKVSGEFLCDKSKRWILESIKCM